MGLETDKFRETIPGILVHNVPIKVIPHLPPSGHRWGHGWGYDHLIVNDPARGAKLTIKCRQIPLSTGQWLDIHNTDKQKNCISCSTDKILVSVSASF